MEKKSLKKGQKMLGKNDKKWREKRAKNEIFDQARQVRNLGLGLLDALHSEKI